MKVLKSLLSVFIVLSVFTFLTSPALSQEIITNQKLITVDVGKQRLFAWDNGQIVFEAPVSTGMRFAPTVKGSFKIYRKVALKDMRGEIKPYKKYYLKDVPNVMYFHQLYAIHGTWWHNSFGNRASHGCVNVPVPASQWLFDWAPIGTRVEVF